MESAVKGFRKFFRGVSWVQALAGGLAAVTSFLLSARIGLAGSVIGVAIAAIVSTLASQLYTNMLGTSADKIKRTIINSSSTDSDDTSDHASDQTAKHPFDHSPGKTKADSNEPADRKTGGMAEPDHETEVIESPGSPGETGEQQVARSSSRRIVGTSGLTSRRPRVIGSARFPAGGRAGDAGTRTATVVGDARHRRMLIIISVVSALAAVAITAGVISWVTGGKGTDSIVRDAVSPSQVERTPSPVPTDNGTGGNDQPEPTGGSTDNSSSGEHTQSGQPTTSETSSPSPTTSSQQGTTTPPTTTSPSPTPTATSPTGTGTGSPTSTPTDTQSTTNSNSQQ